MGGAFLTYMGGAFMAQMDGAVIVVVFFFGRYAQKKTTKKKHHNLPKNMPMGYELKWLLKERVSTLTFWSCGYFVQKCTHLICKYSSPIDVCMLGLYTV